jgi:hypothetical protein
MTPRWIRIGQLFLCVAIAALGVWSHRRSDWG